MHEIIFKKNINFVYGHFPDVNVCLMESPDGSELCSDDGFGNVIRYTYEKTTNKCKNILFDINCDSGGNVFTTQKECERLCKH